MFDFANSSYSLLIISFVFPIYFKESLAGEKYGDLIWGAAISLSVLLGGLSAPVIGAMADFDARKKAKFLFFASTAALGTGLFYFAPHLGLAGTFLLFLVCNMCFELALVLYDSFLPSVSTPGTAGRISGLGWGLGYVGGVAAMLLLRPLYEKGFGPDHESLYRLTFPMTGLFFLLFALPAFFFLKDSGTGTGRLGLIRGVIVAARRIRATFAEIRQYRKIALFLAAMYFLNDALVTLFAFVPVYGRGALGLSLGEISVLLITVQLTGFPSAVFFGWLGDKKGQRKILLFTLCIWMVVVVLAALARTKFQFFVAAGLTGLVIGSSQSTARAWLSRLIPPEKRSEFFGFGAFASKIAATTGPLLFGAVSVLTGSQRWAMLSLLPMFMISFVLFYRMEE